MQRIASANVRPISSSVKNRINGQEPLAQAGFDSLLNILTTRHIPLVSTKAA
jgi:hypothetical protein